MGRDRTWGALGTFLVVMALATPSTWGATIEIRDTAGQALAGTEIVLEEDTSGARTVVKTDAQGRVDAPPGEYFLWAPGHAGKTVTIGTTPSTVALTPAPWATQIPGGFGRFGVATGYTGAQLEHLNVTSASASQVLRDATGNTVSTSTTNDVDTSTDDPSFSRNGFMLDLPIGLPRFAIGKVRGVASIGPIFGWSDWTFDNRNRETGATTTFTGDGATLGGFGEMVLTLEDCPWFLGLDVSYMTNLGDDARRSVLAPTPGGTVASSADLSYDQLAVGVRVGRAFATGWKVLPSIALSAGLGWQRSRVEIEGRVDRTLADGTSGTLQFRNELKDEGLRGRVGIDARLTNQLPLYARLAASFDDRSFDILAKFSWLFDCDWW